jgi:hypothetical protein
MIRLNSISQNRDFAKKTLDQFVEIMNIEEGPPAAPTETSPSAKPVDPKNSI